MTIPRIAVCSTVAAYKVDGRSESEWLAQAGVWKDFSPAFDVEFFCAMQISQGHDYKLRPLEMRLDELGATVWKFSLHTGETEVSSGSRLKYICMGRNLAHEYVTAKQDITHVLFLDTDTRPPKELIEKLLEVDHPIVGANVPTYGLKGPRVQVRNIALGGDRPAYEFTNHTSSGAPQWDHRRDGARPFPEGADVQIHDLQTAGCLLMTRQAIDSIRWGWALDLGQTDDPWTENLAVKAGLGKVWVRHDVHCTHYPEAIGPVEGRGHDLSILDPIA